MSVPYSVCLVSLKNAEDYRRQKRRPPQEASERGPFPRSPAFPICFSAHPKKTFRWKKDRCRRTVLLFPEERSVLLRLDLRFPHFLKIGQRPVLIFPRENFGQLSCPFR